MNLVRVASGEDMLPGLPALRVLAVDDNPAELALFEDCFSPYGAKVQLLTATTAPMALAELLMAGAEHRPHVAMIDINMPLVSGFELAEQLMRHDVPTILMSTHVDATRTARAREIGALGLLAKPANVRGYADFAEQVLKSARLL